MLEVGLPGGGGGGRGGGFVRTNRELVPFSLGTRPLPPPHPHPTQGRGIFQPGFNQPGKDSEFKINYVHLDSDMFNLYTRESVL